MILRRVHCVALDSVALERGLLVGSVFSRHSGRTLPVSICSGRCQGFGLPVEIAPR